MAGTRAASCMTPGWSADEDASCARHAHRAAAQRRLL